MVYKKIFPAAAAIIIIISSAFMILSMENGNTQAVFGSAQVSVSASTGTDIGKKQGAFIFSNVDDKKNSDKIIFSNGWKTQSYNGKYYFIAEFGCLKSDKSQGAVIVRKMEIDTGRVLSERTLLTPEKHGIIKGTSFSSVYPVIGVEADDGTTLTFSAVNGFYDDPKILENVKDENNSDVVFTNGWKSDLMEDKYYYLAEFGSLKGDPGQGIIILKQIEYETGKIISEKRFLTPEKRGPVKITQFNAFNLSLKAEDGCKWIFNLSGQFTHQS